MVDAKFSVTWDSYQKNICNGLSSLQQRGEFVDMTLAADGHHVKVHQMVLSLISPYIKDLIISAQCPHPVIFLNKISYSTLCAILEYAYTGEVLVSRDRLGELFEAGKALQIKGLDDVFEPPRLDDEAVSSSYDLNSTNKDSGNKQFYIHKEVKVKNSKGLDINEDSNDRAFDDTMDDDHDMTADNEKCENSRDNIDTIIHRMYGGYENKIQPYENKEDSILKNTMLQYSVSTQGKPQIVLNRYIYHLRYTRKISNTRQWRCSDYNSRKCPAGVTTKDDKVLGRSRAHNHPFHDKQILKKIRNGNIFYALQEAENQGLANKTPRATEKESQDSGNE